VSIQPLRHVAAGRCPRSAQAGADALTSVLRAGCCVLRQKQPPLAGSKKVDAEDAEVKREIAKEYAKREKTG
jgi:hypothetical protein